MDTTIDESLYLSGLNDKQKEAVLSSAKQLVVIAGAGSGKTLVVVRRMAYAVVQQLAMPEQILALTFTNKAASEFKSRFSQLLGLYLPWSGTFHSLGLKLLRSHHELVDLPDSFRVLDTQDVFQILKKIIKQQNLDLNVKDVLSFISKAKEKCIRGADLLDSSPMQASHLMVKVYLDYENYCQERGVVDFSEILLRLYELLRDYNHIREQYQQLYKYIFVDEFQDTNNLQYLILNFLYCSENSITIVGDEDQSIYGWRGAEVKNIKYFKDAWPNHKMVVLDQNYRSAPSILLASNELIKNNKDRWPKKLWTNRLDDTKILVTRGRDQFDEAKIVLQQIMTWLESSSEHSLDDICILYRANSQSRVFEQLLTEYQVPHNVYGGLRFFERAEVKDILSYITILLNPSAEDALDRIINVPARRIGGTALDALSVLAGNYKVSRMHALQHHIEELGSNHKNIFDKFMDIYNTLLSRIDTLECQYIVEEIIELTGYKQYLKLKYKDQADSRLQNLDELMIAIAQYSKNYKDPDKTNSKVLLEFCNDAILITENVEHAQGGSELKLMTLHAAKGLEFECVAISGMAEGIFPSFFSDTPESLEEERRLFYVGMTRAKQKLILSYAQKKSFQNDNRLYRSSIFLNELPKEHLDIHKQALVISSSLRAKSRVRHPIFGSGTVLAVSGDGFAKKAQVLFDSGCTKLLLTSKVKMEIL